MSIAYTPESTPESAFTDETKSTATYYDESLWKTMLEGILDFGESTSVTGDQAAEGGGALLDGDDLY